MPDDLQPEEPVVTNEPEITETPEAPETPDEPAPEPQPEPEPEPKPEGKGKVPAWAQKRFNELTREKEEARQEAERYRVALEKAAAPAAEPGQRPEPGRSYTPDQIKTLAEEGARQIAARHQFDAACNAVYEKGKGEFPDFDDAVRNFQMLGGLPVPFLEAVTALDGGHKVLRHLGQDPDEAARVLALPPVRQAVELARLEAALDKPRPVSAAPAPIKPLGGKASPAPDLDDPNLPMDVWVKENQKRWENKRW